MITLKIGKFDNVPPHVKKLNCAQAVAYIHAEQDRFCSLVVAHPSELRALANQIRLYLVEKFDLSLPNEYTFPIFAEEDKVKRRSIVVTTQALLLICHLEESLKLSRMYEGDVQEMIDEVTRLRALDVGVTDRHGRKYVKRHQDVYSEAIALLSSMHGRKVA